MVDRTEKVANGIKREIILIIQEEINDPRVKNVTITRVEMSRDMRLAKVFYEVFSEARNKKEIARGLGKAVGFIRSSLADRACMKYVPEISFREDLDRVRKETIDDIFRKIKEETGGRENSDE